MNNERLLQRKQTSQNYFQTKYDPYKCPPDLIFAEKHKKATKIGKLPEDLSQDLFICECCGNVVNKTEFGLLCNVDQFASLGVGYTLFFILYKYFAAILIFVFIVSGGAFFFVVSFDCHQSCVKFFGIPIMSEKMAFSSSVKVTQIVHGVTAVAILGLVIMIKRYLSEDIVRIQKKVLCPSQYTIMIQNLPKEKLDVYKFKKWIYQNFKCTPILINIAYSTKAFFRAQQQRQQLEIERNKLRIKLRQMIKSTPIQNTNNSLQLTNTEVRSEIQSIDRKIYDLNQTLEAYHNNQIQHKEIGTVFVTFNSADQVQKILETHEKNFFNILLERIAGIFYSHKLQYQGHQLVFYPAPAPRQIIWENLEFSYIRHLFFEVCFVIGMIFFMLLTFRIQFWFVNLMYKLRHEGETTGKVDVIFQGVMMSLIIMVLNILLRVVIQYLTTIRKSYSFTRQQSSFTNYYSMIFVINSCFTIYIVHGTSVQSSNRLLLLDIHTIMLTNAFSEPLFKLFDPIMWWKMYQKMRVQKLDPSQNPYPQSFINRLWEGHQISNADNYQYIIRVLFITVWFSTIAPLGVLFSLLGMLCDYWIIKFLFIKVYKQPKNLSKNIMKSLNSLELLPLVYIGGIMPFLYKITFTLNIQTFFNLLFHYGITTVMILFCILGYLYKFRPKNKYISEQKYSDIDLAFGYNYETENPITKFIGQRHFLQQILKKQNFTQASEVVKNILTIHENSLGDHQVKNPQVSKLKLNLLRRIESKIQNNEPMQVEMKKMQSNQSDIRQSFPWFVIKKNSNN